MIINTLLYILETKMAHVLLILFSCMTLSAIATPPEQLPRVKPHYYIGIAGDTYPNLNLTCRSENEEYADKIRYKIERQCLGRDCSSYNVTTSPTSGDLSKPINIKVQYLSGPNETIKFTLEFMNLQGAATSKVKVICDSNLDNNFYWSSTKNSI